MATHQLEDAEIVHMTEEERQCHLQWSMAETAHALLDGRSPFCNVTWDSILCWPLIPLNRSIRLPCPGSNGQNHSGFAERHCRQRGQPRNGHVEAVGWSDYSQCFNVELTTKAPIDLRQKLYPVVESNGNDHGGHWTSADNGEGGLIESLAAIQRGARQLETVGLLVTIFVICATIYVLHRCRRLQLQENLVRIYVLVSLVMLAIAKCIVMLDMSTAAESVLTAHTRGWCQVWYFLLEFFKACLNFWFFFRSFALFCLIFATWKQRRGLRECPYLFSGWLAPILTSITWLTGLVVGGDSAITKRVSCPELYYHTSEYWSVLLPQLATMLLSIGFLIAASIIVGRQLHRIRSEIHVTLEHSLSSNHHHDEAADAMLSASTMSSTATILGDLSRHKWQLIVEFGVFFLLAFPFALEMFFYAPNRQNLHVVASLSYLASFFSMFQGLFISILYAFAQIFIPTSGHRNSVVLKKFEGQHFDE